MAVISPKPIDRNVPSRGRRLAFVCVGGLLLGLSFPPFPFAPLAWIGLVPLLLIWMDHDSGRAAYTDACGTFLVTSAVAFHWPALHVDPLTAVLSVPGLIVIPMWMAVPFGLAAHWRRRVGPAVGFAMLAALYLLMEWGLRRGPFAFPWGLLGHTHAEASPFFRLARFGGVPLLTAFVLAWNGLAAGLLARARTLRLTSGGAALVGLAASLLPAAALETGDVLRIGLVQPAVPATEWADVDDARRVRVLVDLSDSLLAAGPPAASAGAPPGPGTRPEAAAAADALRPSSDARSDRPSPTQTDAEDRRSPADLDFVVWPETALPPGDEASRTLVRQWVADRGVPLLSGAILVHPSGDAYYNAALYVRPGLPEKIYRKRRLVPFAEHVPFQNRWPWLRRLAVPSGGVAGYARGNTDDLMEIQRSAFGVLICFETLFDDTARSYARRGAGLLVAITQDGWWGNSFGYRQHLAFNRLRAVETGLPLVQTSVSGLTAVIRPDGGIEDRIGWMERDGLAAAVRTARSTTPFVRYGDWVTSLALMTALVIALGTFVRGRV